MRPVRVGADHPYTLITRNSLGVQLLRTGNAQDAIELFSQLKRDHKRVLDRDSREIVTTRLNLAKALEQAGRVADAISELQQLLDDYEPVAGRRSAAMVAGPQTSLPPDRPRSTRSVISRHQPDCAPA